MTEGLQPFPNGGLLLRIKTPSTRQCRSSNDAQYRAGTHRLSPIHPKSNIVNTGGAGCKKIGAVYQADPQLIPPRTEVRTHPQRAAPIASNRTVDLTESEAAEKLSAPEAPIDNLVASAELPEPRLTDRRPKR